MDNKENDKCIKDIDNLKEFIENNKNYIVKESDNAAPLSYDFKKHNEEKKQIIKELKDKRMVEAQRKSRSKFNLMLSLIIISFLILGTLTLNLLHSINKKLERSNVSNKSIEEVVDKRVLASINKDGITIDINEVVSEKKDITIKYTIKNTGDMVEPLPERVTLINEDNVRFEPLYQFNNMAKGYLLKGEAAEGFITFMTPKNDYVMGKFKFKIPCMNRNGLNNIELDFKI